MTQHQIGGIASDGVTARNRAVANSAAVNTSVFADPADYSSIAALDAALTAHNATMYSQTVLDKMSINDKIFALRGIDDAGTI